MAVSPVLLSMIDQIAAQSSLISDFTLVTKIRLKMLSDDITKLDAQSSIPSNSSSFFSWPLESGADSLSQKLLDIQSGVPNGIVQSGMEHPPHYIICFLS
jgi:hypothetical protein